MMIIKKVASDGTSVLYIYFFFNKVVNLGVMVSDNRSR